MGAVKSCLDCPSYGTDKESINFFKKSIGAPVCLRYGKVLGRPGSPPQALSKIAEATATHCPAFGKERPGAPQEIDMTVAMPDITAVEADSSSKELCKSCSSCSHMIRETTVAQEFGWPVALCGVKGKLLLPQRYVYEGRTCELRRFGKPRQDVHDVILMPEFDPMFGDPTRDIISHFINGKEIVDPADYPTDAPVSEEDTARGVRALRRVYNPTGLGEDIYLPVYDKGFFSTELQDLIPQTGDKEHPELYVDHQSLTYAVAAMWTELDETPAFWGQAGVGKTEFFRYMAWLMGLPFHRISITASTELDDLAGKTLYSPDKGTYFQYGRLPRAWMSPGIIVIDEPNTGPVDVWQFLRPLTDNSKQLTLDVNKGENIVRHTDSYLGMAMNPSWDPKNVGTVELGDADINRLMHFFVELPPPELERKIIIDRVALDGWEPPKSMMDVVMAVAASLRGLIDNHTLAGISWGIRPQLKVVRALRFFDPVTAYRVAIANSLDPDARESVLDQVRQHVDNENPPWRK